MATQPNWDLYTNERYWSNYLQQFDQLMKFQRDQAAAQRTREWQAQRQVDLKTIGEQFSMARLRAQQNFSALQAQQAAGRRLDQMDLQHQYDLERDSRRLQQEYENAVNLAKTNKDLDLAYNYPMGQQNNILAYQRQAMIGPLDNKLKVDLFNEMTPLEVQRLQATGQVEATNAALRKYLEGKVYDERTDPWALETDSLKKSIARMSDLTAGAAGTAAQGLVGEMKLSQDMWIQQLTRAALLTNDPTVKRRMDDLRVLSQGNMDHWLQNVRGYMQKVFWGQPDSIEKDIAKGMDALGGRDAAYQWYDQNVKPEVKSLMKPEISVPGQPEQRPGLKPGSQSDQPVWIKSAATTEQPEGYTNRLTGEFTTDINKTLPTAPVTTDDIDKLRQQRDEAMKNQRQAVEDLLQNGGLYPTADYQNGIFLTNDRGDLYSRDYFGDNSDLVDAYFPQMKKMSDARAMQRWADLRDEIAGRRLDSDINEQAPAPMGPLPAPTPAPEQMDLSQGPPTGLENENTPPTMNVVPVNAPLPGGFGSDQGEEAQNQQQVTPDIMNLLAYMEAQKRKQQLEENGEPPYEMWAPGMSLEDALG